VRTVLDYAQEAAEIDDERLGMVEELLPEHILDALVIEPQRDDKTVVVSVEILQRGIRALAERGAVGGVSADELLRHYRGLYEAEVLDILAAIFAPGTVRVARIVGEAENGVSAPGSEFEQRACFVDGMVAIEDGDEVAILEPKGKEAA
jgi:hypothetical protein